MPQKTKEEQFYEKLHKGMLVRGKIKNIQPYGAFVELKKGIVGLLHIEDICICRIRTPEDVLKVGETIVTKVKNYDKDTGRITLTYKELLGTWEDNVKEFQEKTVVKGTIRNQEKFGVFVELKPNLVGLAKSDKRKVSYGDSVDVLIKKISPETKKIKLEILG